MYMPAAVSIHDIVTIYHRNGDTIGKKKKRKTTPNSGTSMVPVHSLREPRGKPCGWHGTPQSLSDVLMEQACRQYAGRPI